MWTYLREERDATGLATDVAARLRGLDPEDDLDRAAGSGLRFVVPGDAEWPARLGDLDRAPALNGRGGAPLGLWLRGAGRLDELAERPVAVVGSRSATTYGVSVAGAIAADLAEAGVSVVSGAAYGIDQAAHRGALAARGPTVAVLACGVDRAYPAAHRDLLGYIAETGLVVSETAPGGAPTKLRFLSRNRVIAALSLGTVVVEAAVRSGALNTANWAASVNRTVMGVPGPVTSAPSEGVHELLRTRDAALVTRGSDVLELVSPAGVHTQDRRRAPETARDRLGRRTGRCSTPSRSRLPRRWRRWRARPVSASRPSPSRWSGSGPAASSSGAAEGGGWPPPSPERGTAGPGPGRAAGPRQVSPPDRSGGAGDPVVPVVPVVPVAPTVPVARGADWSGGPGGAGGTGRPGRPRRPGRPSTRVSCPM